MGVYDTILQESFEALTLGFTPATRSSIESLPKLRLDSLEQATMEQISTCSICKDEFAEGGVDRLISLLPCAHYFHADCMHLSVVGEKSLVPLVSPCTLFRLLNRKVNQVVINMPC